MEDEAVRGSRTDAVTAVGAPGAAGAPRRPAPAGYATTSPDGHAVPAAGSPLPGTDVRTPTHAPVYGRVARFGAVGTANPGHLEAGHADSGTAGRPIAVQEWPPPTPGAWSPPVVPRPGPGVLPPGPPGPAPAEAVPPWASPAPWAGGPPRPGWRPEDHASWLRRVAGLLVDDAPGYLAAALALVAYVPLYAGLLRGDLAARPTWWLLVAAVVLGLVATAWTVWNRWFVAGRTGQSLGKRVTGTWLVSARDGRPVGVLDAFLRDLLHVLDGVAFVGYLWPLWDDQRQTLADKVAGTVVVRTPVPPLTEAELSRRP